MSSLNDDTNSLIPVYIAELAKSGRAECKKCNTKIQKDELRIGIVTESDWGPYTKWQHVQCTIFQNSLTSINDISGYMELSSENQSIVNERFQFSQSQVDEDTIAINPEELVRKDWTIERKPHEDLLMPLLSYQREGLGWLRSQEDSEMKGGILADEMGMGKTIQAIALMLDNRPNFQDTLQISRWDQSDIAHEATNLLKGKNLLVLPTVAIRQWQMEIVRFTRMGSLKVLVYHGSDREVTLLELCEADIVITSYKILEIEYRKATAGTKVECRVCGKKFYPEKLRIHRKYFCGEDAERTEAQSKTEKKLSRVVKRKHSKDSDSDDDELYEDDSEEEVEDEMPSKKRKKNNSKKDDIVEQITKKTVENRTKGKKKIENSKKGKKSFEDEELTINKRKSFSKRFSKSSSSKSSKSSNNNDDEDEDGLDSDVERDIAKALAASRKLMKNKKVSSILHEISWFRIILDEAHLIKDRSTSTAKAIFNLVSLFKWCLTGTPLQNRVGELYSLVRFLRVDPYAYYYCKRKGCECKSLHYRFTGGSCNECHHSSMFHFSHFNKHILNPIIRFGYVNDGRKAMLKLKDEVLDKILLRRTKITRADEIQLPPRLVRVRYDSLDPREEDFYQALYTQSQAQFNTYVQSGTILNNYAHIFDILIKLRQAVDHPYLVIHSNNKTITSDNSSRNIVNSQNITSASFCEICEESIEDKEKRVSECNHVFCFPCISKHINNFEEGRGETSIKNKSPVTLCPVCDEVLNINLDLSLVESNGYQDTISSTTSVALRPSYLSKKKSIIDKIDLSRFQSSSKVEALMQELYEMENKEPGCKAIVFSQFVNMLDIVEYRIRTGGIECSKLLGSMSLEQRDTVIRRFKEDAKVKVLLISLKAGGVALNLTVASKIFLLDPWWNPAAEMQAIDRTHRLGQCKPIHAVRFIIENSIEERILKLQEKKRLVFDGTIGGDSSSISKLTVDDMRFLFH